MIKVHIRKIEEINENEKQSITNSLSDPARERLNKKRNKALYLASLCALSLLSDDERADLYYTENGRPYFKTLDKDISISHSKTCTAVAISNSKNIPVGIDIEDISQPVGDSTLDVSPTRFLTPNEQDSIVDGTPYLSIWAKKEAFFKFLKSDSTPFIRLDSTAPEQYGASFTTTQIENSILTLCTTPNKKIEIIEK